MSQSSWRRRLMLTHYRQFEFTKKGWKSGLPQCVTKKLCGGKDLDDAQISKGGTKWRSGSEGKAACSDCVKAGRPCFTWYEGNDSGTWGELLLLPLHEQDRVKKVGDGFEIRHWLNA